jgi:hypothetical protein
VSYQKGAVRFRLPGGTPPPRSATKQKKNAYPWADTGQGKWLAALPRMKTHAAAHAGQGETQASRERG